MQLCFKAYGVREVSEDTHEFVQLDWIHPREVDSNELHAIMYDLYEMASWEAWHRGVARDWITVVAYNVTDWTAYCSCDYGRSHEESENWYYGDEVYAELQRL